MKRLTQPPNPLFQAVWTFLHLQAAALHIASALYHLGRVSEPTPEEQDKSYEQAVIDARRQR